MRKSNLLIALVAVALASGCEELICSVAGCIAGVEVALVPEVSSTYDVELVLDGVAGALTCTKTQDRWEPTDLTGSAPVAACDGRGFGLEATPESVEIEITAQDGSWTGSINESPNYEFFQPNGPECDGAYGCKQAELTVPKQ